MNTRIKEYIWNAVISFSIGLLVNFVSGVLFQQILIVVNPLVIHSTIVPKPTICGIVIFSVASVISFIIIKKFKVLERLSSQPSIPRRKFDWGLFNQNLNTFENLKSTGTKLKLFEKIRHQLVDLPQGKIPSKGRNDILRLFNIIDSILGKVKWRSICIDMLHIICDKRDKRVNEEMKKMLLNKITRIWPDLTIKEKSYVLSIIQELHENKLEMIENITRKAVEEWSEEEFTNLLKRINFHRLKKGDLKILEEQLFYWRSKAEKAGQYDKIERIDKILELNYFH